MHPMPLYAFIHITWERAVFFTHLSSHELKANRLIGKVVWWQRRKIELVYWGFVHAGFIRPFYGYFLFWWWGFYACRLALFALIFLVGIWISPFGIFQSVGFICAEEAVYCIIDRDIGCSLCYILFIDAFVWQGRKWRRKREIIKHKIGAKNFSHRTFLQNSQILFFCILRTKLRN